MFQFIKYEDKREVFGFKVHSFSAFDKIKKYDEADNTKSAERPFSIEVGKTKRTINLYAIASTIDFTVKIGHNVLKHTANQNLECDLVQR